MSGKKRFVFLILLLPFFCSNIFAQKKANTFSDDSGEVKFISDAPLELITGHSENLSAFLNPVKRTFAFVINMKTFNGFNGGLQRIHFNENYLESDKYPNASFSGEIMESYDFSKPGMYDVQAKGILDLHGIKKERTIKAIVKITDNTIEIYSKFTIALNDHKIKIPKIVNDKVSSEVYVTVHSLLK
jgi:hypothetical protein